MGLSSETASLFKERVKGSEQDGQETRALGEPYQGHGNQEDGEGEIAIPNRSMEICRTKPDRTEKLQQKEEGPVKAHLPF